MASRLYECRVTHARFHPRTHRFAYRLFFIALDLDDLPALSRRLRLLRIDSPGPLSFRQHDYLPGRETLHNASPSAAPSGHDSPPLPPDAPLKSRVLAHLASHGVETTDGARVLLLTLPRILGYQFNPVSFYFVSAADGSPLAALAEVTNTFRETKVYLLGPGSRRDEAALGPTFRLRVPKHFYVSPFSDVDVAFEFRLRPPGERMALQIDDFAGERRTLVSTVTSPGPPRPLGDRALAWFSLKYPFVTLKVIAAIHWEALRLWLKRVPWFAKAARASEQRDLHRPHASIAPRPACSATEKQPPASPAPRTTLPAPRLLP